MVPPLMTASMRAPGAGGDRVRGAVPRDAGLQLGELVGRVATAEHVEHAVERVVGQLVERVGVARHRLDRADRHGVGHRTHGHRHDLLGQHVERVARHPRGLDLPRLHRGDGDRAHRAGRRGTSGRCGRGWPRRPGARRGRCAADPRPPTAATRRTPRGRSRPCRCRVRAWTWPPARAACPPSAGLRFRAAARARSTRGGRATSSSSASSLMHAASRSARRRLFTKISVDLWARISVEQLVLQRRPDAVARLGRCRRRARSSSRRRRRSPPACRAAPCLRPARRCRCRTLSACSRRRS